MKFHEMTFPELRLVSRSGVVVMAPIAACEQHSRHHAGLTDTVLVPRSPRASKNAPPKRCCCPRCGWGKPSSPPLWGTLSATWRRTSQIIVGR